MTFVAGQCDLRIGWPFSFLLATCDVLATLGLRWSRRGRVLASGCQGPGFVACHGLKFFSVNFIHKPNSTLDRYFIHLLVALVLDIGLLLANFLINLLFFSFSKVLQI